MSWTVLSDFDHTISIEDATDVLLERYALPEWHDIETLWQQGAIGSRECMQQQIALLRATPEQVETLADQIRIDPHFKSFALLCAARQVPLVILSDGLDFIIRRVLKREGLDHLHVIASHLAPTHDDRWELTAPFANDACSSKQSTCKCAISRQMRSVAGEGKILYIGDGRSDFCVSMEEADMVLAKDSLLGYCQKNALPHHPFETFAHASSLLETLVPATKSYPSNPEESLYA